MIARVYSKDQIPPCLRWLQEISATQEKMIENAFLASCQMFGFAKHAVELTMKPLEPDFVELWRGTLESLKLVHYILDDYGEEKETTFQAARPKEGFTEALQAVRRLKPKMWAIRFAHYIAYRDYGTKYDWDERLVDRSKISESEYHDFVSRYPNFNDYQCPDSEGETEEERSPVPTDEPIEPFLSVWRSETPIVKSKTVVLRLPLQLDETQKHQLSRFLPAACGHFVTDK